MKTYYRVTHLDRHWPGHRMTNTVEATSPHDAMMQVRQMSKAYDQILRVTKDNTYEQREAIHQHWMQVYSRAIANMPAKRRKDGRGDYGCLARILGYPLYTVNGKYGAHNRIYANMSRGSKPKDQEVQRKLQLLAGPHGKILAWLALGRLGIQHWYVKPTSW